MRGPFPDLLLTQHHQSLRLSALAGFLAATRRKQSTDINKPRTPIRNNFSTCTLLQSSRKLWYTVKVHFQTETKSCFNIDIYWNRSIHPSIFWVYLVDRSINFFLSIQLIHQSIKSIYQIIPSIYWSINLSIRLCIHQSSNHRSIHSSNHWIKHLIHLPS